MKSMLCLLALILMANAAPVRAAGAMDEACQRLFAAMDDYQRAVDRHDFMATVDAQNETLKQWRMLSPELRRWVEEEYPGTLLWLEGGESYSGSGSAPPQRPIRRRR